MTYRHLMRRRTVMRSRMYCSSPMNGVCMRQSRMGKCADSLATACGSMRGIDRTWLTATGVGVFRRHSVTDSIEVLDAVRLGLLPVLG